MMYQSEGRSVAIDFRLTARQRELQLRSRKFAREVLSPALQAEALPTPEQRFAATKPAYEAMIAAGFLRECIPFSAGGPWQYRDHGRGALRGERQRYLEVDWNRPWTVAAPDRWHGGSAAS